MNVGDKVRLTKRFLKMIASDVYTNRHLNFFRGQHVIRRIDNTMRVHIECPVTIGLGDGYYRLRKGDYVLIRNESGDCKCSWQHCRKSVTNQAETSLTR